jgi:hypothetical protein
VVVAPDGVAGRVAGEQLHFTDGRALAAIPLGATDSLELEVVTVSSWKFIEGTTVWMPVEKREPPNRRERLQTPERFTAPPDSAMRVRINRERGLSLDAAIRAHEVPRLWTTPFLLPRTTRVTSPFGAGREVNGVWRSTHVGLISPAGRVSPACPIAASSLWLATWWYFRTCTTARAYDRYHHLSRALVSAGDIRTRPGHRPRQCTGRSPARTYTEARYGAISFDRRSPDALSKSLLLRAGVW